MTKAELMPCKRMFCSVLIVSCLYASFFVAHCAETPKADRYKHENDPKYWFDLGEKDLQAALNPKQRGVAKNIIMFLGDGMGMTTVTAGRIWAGQKRGLYGEEYQLSWDKFPYTGLAKTYTLDMQTSDSASSGTAFLCGVKTRKFVLGLNGRASRGNCSSVKGNKVDSILNWAIKAGKSVGFVTTTRVTHATPAAAYAKCPDRRWEIDTRIPESERACKDIAYQLATENPMIQVIMGGGRAAIVPKEFDPKPDPKFDAKKWKRADGLNLLDEWYTEKIKNNISVKVVHDKHALDDVDPETTDFLLGLFNQDHMSYEVDRNKTDEPSIAEMTSKAIKILRKNPKGFFLLVEGGGIDTANHVNWAHKALAEVDAMDQAVQTALNLTSDRDTLTVVTADHSHVLSIAGYAARGNSITGLSKDAKGKPDVRFVKDKMPYTSLIFGNGPGRSTSTRQNLTGVDVDAISYKVDAAVPMALETHGGEDVAIYAKGPHAFLFTGTHEQSYIAHAVAYASCLGPYSGGKLCARTSRKPDQSQQVDQPSNAMNVSAKGRITFRIKEN